MGGIEVATAALEMQILPGHVGTNARDRMDAMASDRTNTEARRVRDEVITRLESSGATTSPDDTDDALARLLDVVEQFERKVELRGGDRMVDEPVTGSEPLEPDDARFVLPQRAPREGVESFIERIIEARDRL